MTGWQGIGVALEDAFTDDDHDTVVAFYKQGDEDQAPCFALLSQVELLTEATEARAALAQPESEGPTLDDIWELCEEHGFVLGIDGANEEESANGLWAIARAVLARWGRPTPQPVDAEVAMLVAWLRDRAAGNDRFGAPTAAALMQRAADLLTRPTPQPISVSERLPGPEDCDAEGRCWCWNPPSYAGGLGWWSHEPLEWADSATHWLPAHALPVPAEVTRG